MQCACNRNENIKKAESYIIEAAENGANIVLLPELFERPYFCQERNYAFYSYAEPAEQNRAVQT